MKTKPNQHKPPTQPSTLVNELVKLGLKPGLQTLAYIHLVKAIDNVRYPAWLEIIPKCTVTSCDGYQIVLGIHTNDQKLMLKLITRLISILNELKEEGYRDER
jgi:hypothetical protein